MNQRRGDRTQAPSRVLGHNALFSPTADTGTRLAERARIRAFQVCRDLCHFSPLTRNPKVEGLGPEVTQGKKAI